MRTSGPGPRASRSGKNAVSSTPTANCSVRRCIHRSVQSQALLQATLNSSSSSNSSSFCPNPTALLSHTSGASKHISSNGSSRSLGSSSSSALGGRSRRVACRATLDDPELRELVAKMDDSRPDPATRDRTKLQAALAKIDAINEKDPKRLEWEGKSWAYRVLYGEWTSRWVLKLDPGAPDELLILAKGKSLESWRLSEIKRDDYAPNSGGQKQWARDRKQWVSNRLTGVMKEAGYGDVSIRIVEDVMLDRDLPNPRDMRKADVIGGLGLINYRKLEEIRMLQTLRDAEALVFLEQSFPKAFESMPADETLDLLRKEMRLVSGQAMVEALDLPWTPVQKRLVLLSLPQPKNFSRIMGEVEAVAAGSKHPGDWRFSQFDDYE